MRALSLLGIAAMLAMTFQLATSGVADAAGKKRLSKTYCPPMPVRR